MKSHLNQIWIGSKLDLSAVVSVNTLDLYKFLSLSLLNHFIRLDLEDPVVQIILDLLGYLSISGDF